MRASGSIVRLFIYATALLDVFDVFECSTVRASLCITFGCRDAWWDCVGRNKKAPKFGAFRAFKEFLGCLIGGAGAYRI